MIHIRKDRHVIASKGKWGSKNALEIRDRRLEICKPAVRVGLGYDGLPVCRLMT